MRSRSTLFALLTSVVLLVAPPHLAAQRLTSMGVELENDFFLTFDPRRGTDHEYTHGSRVWTELRGDPGPLRFFTSRMVDCDHPGVACTTRLELGQEIYTPRSALRSRPPLRGHRPYAGWLYLHLGIVEVGPRAANRYFVRLGVTGPPSLAEHAQAALHRAFDFREPYGWEYQLPQEVGLILHGDRTEEMLALPVMGLAFSGGYNALGEIGNVLTHAGAGVWAQLAIGSQKCCGSGMEGGSGSLGLVVRGEIGPRLVLRNLFLDGSTFRRSHSVRKEPVVMGGKLGIGIQVRKLTLTYEVTARGREYQTEPTGFAYASVAVRVRN